MNIDDVNKCEVPNQPFVYAIFTMQAKLMEKYDKIESSNGFNVPSYPWNLDSKFVQARIKDMFWRVTEEFTEACENIATVCKIMMNPKYKNNFRLAWDDNSEIRHFFEEIIDALHFLTEATILSDMTDQSKKDIHNSFGEIFVLGKKVYNKASFRKNEIKLFCYEVIQNIGLAANCLKNKPWKQTPMGTDQNKFRVHLHLAWETFFNFWRSLNADDNDLYTLYFKKNTVNQFRQRSNY